MGIFDFLCGRRKAAARAGQDDVDLKAFMAREQAARAAVGRQRYVYGHIALRQILLQEPMGALGLLASPRAEGFLQELWDAVTEDLQKAGELAPDPYPGVEIHRLRLGQFPAAILVMPAPKTTTEPYMVALVLEHDLSRELTPEDKPAGRYFTLERSVDLGQGVHTVFCEWTSEGTHMNMGEGPPPEVGAFAQRIEACLARAAAH